MKKNLFDTSNGPYYALPFHRITLREQFIPPIILRHVFECVVARRFGATVGGSEQEEEVNRRQEETFTTFISLSSSF